MRERFAKATAGLRGSKNGARAGGDGSLSVSPVAPGDSVAGPAPADTPAQEYDLVDLEHRRDQLQARVAELQWDLGGLVYEMATRDRIRVDILVKRAAVLQDADAELAEVERILRMEQTATAGACSKCGAPHSSGAVFCWQCGNPILRQVDTSSIMAP
ncbi:MAG: zinc ribbon domain-containing protein [Solirubrobacteraceae bacterium]